MFTFVPSAVRLSTIVEIDCGYIVEFQSTPRAGVLENSPHSCHVSDGNRRFRSEAEGRATDHRPDTKGNLSERPAPQKLTSIAKAVLTPSSDAEGILIKDGAPA